MQGRKDVEGELTNLVKLANESYDIHMERCVEVIKAPRGERPTSSLLGDLLKSWESEKAAILDKLKGQELKTEFLRRVTEIRAEIHTKRAAVAGLESELGKLRLICVHDGRSHCGVCGAERVRDD